MIPAVAGDFMPGGSDTADQSGIARRDPAEGEEGPANPGLAEHGEHGVGIALYAVKPAVPACLVDRVLESADLEPVLDVDG